MADPQDQVSDYLAQIGATPLLTAEEETALAKRMEAGAYASHLLEQGAAEPGLEAVAADGRAARQHMIEAVERFDHTRGNRFSTVATWWIRKAIQHGALTGIRMPRMNSIMEWWVRSCRHEHQRERHSRTVMSICRHRSRTRRSSITWRASRPRPPGPSDGRGPRDHAGMPAT
ncbi:sigma-70 factor domain-containing protein [Nonomuraea glycinis]|uniref:sigma-70 factor domain-containing protein n=1 Tax=Nonomuraea glycinis TaxID=2047744 RepID=UPI0033B6AF10